MKCWIIKTEKCSNCNFCTDSIKNGGLGFTKKEKLRKQNKGEGK